MDLGARSGRALSATESAVIAAVGLLNIVAWATFRIDKRRAEQRRRRIRESTLLGLAALGGLGALLAMYGHHRRHKVNKGRFAAVVWLAVLAQVALAAWLATSAWP